MEYREEVKRGRQKYYWTDEKVNQLIKLRNNGMSYKECEKYLVSPDAIAGIVYRVKHEGECNG